MTAQTLAALGGGIESVVIMATACLLFTGLGLGIGRRLPASGGRFVHMEPPQTAARVPPAPSKPQDRAARVRPSVPDQMRGPGLAATRTPEPEPVVPHTAERARVWLRPADHISELIAHLVAEGYGRPAGCSELARGRYSSRVWMVEYHAWARRVGVAVLPESVFLTLLGKHPLIAKSRDRVKDPATGSVLKNSNGTPLREANYTLLEAAPQLVTVRSTETGRRKTIVKAQDMRRAA